MPIILTITGDRTATFAVGDGPAVAIEELGMIDGRLTGGTQGDLGTPDTRRWQLAQLALSLKLRGTSIDGEIQAWRFTDRHMTALPHWAVLRRDTQTRP